MRNFEWWVWRTCLSHTALCTDLVRDHERRGTAGKNFGSASKKYLIASATIMIAAEPENARFVFESARTNGEWLTWWNCRFSFSSQNIKYTRVKSRWKDTVLFWPIVHAILLVTLFTGHILHSSCQLLPVTAEIFVHLSEIRILQLNSYR